MLMDFSQIDTSSISRMALFFGILAAGLLILPIVVAGILKLIRMPYFVIRVGVVCTGLGWFYYWVTHILTDY